MGDIAASACALSGVVSVQCSITRVLSAATDGRNGPAARRGEHVHSLVLSARLVRRGRGWGRGGARPEERLIDWPPPRYRRDFTHKPTCLLAGERLVHRLCIRAAAARLHSHKTISAPSRRHLGLIFGRGDRAETVRRRCQGVCRGRAEMWPSRKSASVRHVEGSEAWKLTKRAHLRRGRLGDRALLRLRLSRAGWVCGLHLPAQAQTQEMKRPSPGGGCRAATAAHRLRLQRRLWRGQRHLRLV